MKATNVKYCSECQRNFEDVEIVWFAEIENTCFCRYCKAKLEIKKWEPRLFIKEEMK